MNDYNLLHFNTILVNQTGSTPLNVPCHTEPACTAFTANSVLLNSILTPGQDPVTLTGPSYITAAYDYSPVSFFDPYAWYFGKYSLETWLTYLGLTLLIAGCVTADLEAVASAPVSCSITATGVNSVGKTIYSQVFNFNAPLLTPTVPMQLGYFDQGWSGLRVQTLYLSVSNNATTAAVFDNFLATVYGPQNAAVLVDF